ncbi:hypothetical protein HHI36_019217 [Cryptolaemus montrouzieri]|uniref:RNA helicase n=1 Tax=Cryptolaemus montrouzieri TaxID=559131 RepID=A0ABD2P2J1_9CUCU
MEATEVDIPIFLHPHLFWVFEKKNTVKRHQLQCELTNQYEYSLDIDREFTIGEMVVVKRNHIWCRAIVEDLIEDGSFKYEVWLMDYGHLYHSNLVYKLHQKFKFIPAMVKQASLHNVVFVDETFSLESNCINKLKNFNPNAGATLNALQFLKDYTLFFLKKKEVSGIYFGDVLYKKNGRTSFLTLTMIEKNLMVEDKNLFEKVESSRIYDKDFHIQALRRASKNHKDTRCTIDFSILMGEVFTKNTGRGISLGGYNTQSETEEQNIPKSNTSKINILKRLKRRLNVHENKAESCTESEIEESVVVKHEISETTKISEGENGPNSEESEAKHASENSNENILFDTREKPSNNEVETCNVIESVKKAPNKFLALKLRNRRREERDSCNSFSDVESNSSVSSISTPTTIIEQGGNKGTPKLLQAPNTLFLPSGQRSLSSILTKKTKKKASSTSYTYSSDSSLTMLNKRPKISSSEKESLLNTKKDINDVEISKNEKVNENMKDKSDQDWSDTCTKSAELTEGSQMVIKPPCSCKECDHWTNSDDWRMGAETFNGESKIKPLKIYRPSSLLLKDKRTDDVKLSSINYRAMSKLEKQAAFKILVHGRLLPTPIDRVTEAPFHPIIHRSLKNLGYISARKIQSYIWPAVSRSINVCYIHRKHSGKTLAYLPPLCTFLLERDERYGDLKKGGPIVLILGSSTMQCQNIYDLANKLMDGSGLKRPKSLFVSYPFEHINLSSVDLLITIPSILVELLKKNATNMKRLCHLVLEDVNVLMERYPEEINSIIRVIESMLTHRVTRHNVQIIVSGMYWTLEVENLAKKLREIPVICIGDYLQAAIYGRIKLKLKCVQSEAKRDTVIDILKDKWNISFIAITNELPKEEILQQEANWELPDGGDYRVLLCTDQILETMLSITSAALMIHYSLPEKWTYLIKRFNCLLENYKSPLISENNKLVCESYILTDELCDAQIPRLLSLLKNYNVPLNQFEPIYKQIMNEKEMTKVKTKQSICSFLKKFGSCPLENCSNRHIFQSDLDSNPSLPKNGSIKFKILEVIDVNHLKVNIIEHKDIDGKVTPFKTRSHFDDTKLTSIMNVRRKNAEDVVNGQSYVFWDTEEFDDVFRECIVEEFKLDKVAILVKENGRRMLVCKSKIFELPEELNDESIRHSSGVELILANLKPPYKDENFSLKARLNLMSFIEDLKYDDNLFVANICLQLGDILWVDNITEEVYVFDMNVTKTNMTKELIKKKLAEQNDEHLKTLYGLCKDAGIVLPKYDIPVKKIVEDQTPQVTPQWAFLEIENCNKVYFSSAVSPEEIYVRLEKFSPLLTRLENEIVDIVRRQGSKRDFIITAGRYYAAKDAEENKFVRVLIKQIENDEALCYAVDYGDESLIKLEDIRYLPNNLITKLPFQAIQCRLHGIKAVDEEWNVDAIDLLYNKFSLEDDSDIYRTLFAKCLYYEKGIFRGQSKFSILLKDAYEVPIVINQLIVDCGWAEMSPNANLSDFEIPPEKQESEDEYLIKDKETEDLEEIEDIFKKTEIITSNMNESTKNNATDSANCEMDFYVEGFFGDPEEEEEQFINFMNAMVNAGKERKSLISSTNNTLPAIEAAPFEVDYYTPDIYWSQTKETVKIVIKLPNIKTYKVNVEKSRIFSFHTTINEKKYAVNLMLYEAVDKNITHTLGGLEVRINLKKKEEVEWSKLSRSKTRLRNVHYILSKEEVEDQPKRLFLDLGDDLRDNVSTDEDAPMYMVESDLDSEYDMDLGDDTDS